MDKTVEQKFGPGSVVRLNSGGPAMVISRGRSGGDWLCHWMSPSGTANEGAFAHETLQACKPDAWPIKDANYPIHGENHPGAPNPEGLLEQRAS